MVSAVAVVEVVTAGIPSGQTLYWALAVTAALAVVEAEAVWVPPAAPAELAATDLSFCIGLKDIDMKKAWVENGVIRDIAPGDPAVHYVDAVAALYDVDVPDDAANGDSFRDGVLIKLPIPIRPEPVFQPTMLIAELRGHMTFSERVMWDNDSKPEIKTVKLDLVDGMPQPAMKEIVAPLVELGIISQATFKKMFPVES